MTKIVIDIFMYMFEGLLIFYYSNSLFPLKRSKKVQTASIAFITFALFAVYQLNITYLNAVLFFITNCLLFCFLYQISFKTAAFHSFIFLLARAIYKWAPIIILDEPTAALDPIAENELYLKYDEITKERTSFYISHRLASTAFCDKILFLEDGKITETGTHKALMDARGKYFKMYSMQSYYYNVENAGGAQNEKAI